MIINNNNIIIIVERLSDECVDILKTAYDTQERSGRPSSPTLQ